MNTVKPEVAAKVPRDEIKAAFGCIVEESLFTGILRQRMDALAEKYGVRFADLEPWVRTVLIESAEDDEE